MSIVIRDIHIVTQDNKRRQFRGSVYVEDGIISQISKEKISTEADYKIDGKNKVLLPGLINTHTHINSVVCYCFNKIFWC